MLKFTLRTIHLERHDECLWWLAGQASTSTTGAKKRAAPKRTKKDPGVNSDAPQKPDPPKTKTRRKRKPSTSDDSDSNFEKMISKAVTSKVSVYPNQSFCYWCFKTYNQAFLLIIWHIFKKINLNPIIH